MYLLLGLAILVAYLIGSFPTGVVMARLLGWPDPRERDSGHTGALNTYRAGGLLAFLTVALIDIAKGVLAVLLASYISTHPWAVPLSGAAAIAGHNWPIYIRFRGGMGLATAAGAVGSHSFLIVLAGIAVWFLLNAIIHHRQRAMALTMLTIPPGLWLLKVSVQTFWLGTLCAAVVFARHLADWQRHYDH
jgi:glycerol-3-phosphate acyltransferase PlsY